MARWLRGIPRAGQPTPPVRGNSVAFGARALARMGAWADTWGVMYESNRGAVEPGASPPRRMLVMAIFAPFGVIALLASPLLIDTLRHVSGL